MATDIIYLNGEFMPLEEARIPVLDRGFIFGDGVYEVIPVYSRHPFRLPEHLQRLQHSLDGIRLANPLSDPEWTRLTHDIVARNPGDDQSIYFQITRGVAKRAHEFPQNVKPTVFMMSSPLVTPPPEQVENGIACITATDFRWLKCDVKSVSLLGNCLLKQAAVDAGVVEVVMFRDGYLTEASASNVCVVRNGVLLAPPKESPDPARHHLRRSARARPCGQDSARGARSVGAGSQGRAGDLDYVVDQGSAGGDHTRRPRRRRRQARCHVPPRPRAVSGLQANGDAPRRVTGIPACKTRR